MEVSLPATVTGPITPPHARAHSRKSPEPMLNPYTIIVDTAEQNPYDFQGLHADSDRKNRLLIVTPGINIIRQCLGRHPHSLGDYSIEGFVGRCHVERKTMDDAHGTFLGWDNKRSATERRERFEQELANLANIECAAVVVECSFGQLLDEAPEYDRGKKTAACNRKILERSVLAWQQDYQVPFIFCDGRRQAEEITFRFLDRFWQKHKKELQK